MRSDRAREGLPLSVENLLDMIYIIQHISHQSGRGRGVGGGKMSSDLPRQMGSWSSGKRGRRSLRR